MADYWVTDPKTGEKYKFDAASDDEAAEIISSMDEGLKGTVRPDPKIGGEVGVGEAPSMVPSLGTAARLAAHGVPILGQFVDHTEDSKRYKANNPGLAKTIEVAGGVLPFGAAGLATRGLGAIAGPVADGAIAGGAHILDSLIGNERRNADRANAEATQYEPYDENKSMLKARSDKSTQDMAIEGGASAILSALSRGLINKVSPGQTVKAVPISKTDPLPHPFHGAVKDPKSAAEALFTPAQIAARDATQDAAKDTVRGLGPIGLNSLENGRMGRSILNVILNPPKAKDVLPHQGNYRPTEYAASQFAQATGKTGALKALPPEPPSVGQALLAGLAGTAASRYGLGHDPMTSMLAAVASGAIPAAYGQAKYEIAKRAPEIITNNQLLQRPILHALAKGTLASGGVNYHWPENN